MNEVSEPLKLALRSRVFALWGVCVGVAVAAPAPSWATDTTYLGAHSASSLVSQLINPVTLGGCGVEQAVIAAVPAEQQQPLELLQRWQQHPLADFLGCFSVVRYQADQLECQQQGSRNRADCRLTSLPKTPKQRQIIFTARQVGIASAGEHQIILPVAAELSLFAHEVAHWLGLADEYAMSKELATDFCAGRYRHPSLNVVVTATRELTAAQLQALWQRLPWRWAVASWQQLGQANRAGTQYQLGSEQGVGLYEIPACAHAEGYAWRPVAEYTPMQYHDIGQWPEIYLELIRRQN